MKTRLANIIAAAAQPDGSVNREQVYRALMIEPGDPVTIVVEAVIEVKLAERLLINALDRRVTDAERTLEKDVAQIDSMHRAHGQLLETYAQAAAELSTVLKNNVAEAQLKHGERLSQIAGLHEDLVATATAVKETRDVVRWGAIAVSFLYGAIAALAGVLVLKHFFPSFL